MITTSNTEYLPARMINEFVYCPRLFFYQYVEKIFVDNVETVEGTLQHRRVDEKEEALPSPEELVECDRPVRARSVMLSSDRYGVIARMDLVEVADQTVTPVDYKRGRPRENTDGSLEAWDTDRVQLCVQALVLQDNGYCCNEAIVYYAKTRQRVRIPIDDSLVEQTLAAIHDARQLAENDTIPPPLVDSPKCPRCSLVGVCLPDETRQCTAHTIPNCPRQLTLFEVGDVPQVRIDTVVEERESMRRLVAARNDLRPLYLNQQGMSVGKSGAVLKIKDRQRMVQEVRIHEICQLNLFGNVQMTTQAIQTLCYEEVPIAYFSHGGWFYGVTHGLGVKNINLRREQFRWADVKSFCLCLARSLVAGKIKNQRTLLQRNHVEPPRAALVQMKCLMDDARRAVSFEQLLGIEGNAARVYFQQFSGMIKVNEHHDDRDVDADDVDSTCRGASNDHVARGFTLDFTHRNRRPPRDPVNALLSLAYSVLAKDLTITCHTVGFDPYLGFFHQPRFGRAPLALDLMEPFRPLIADSAVLAAINTRMVTASDFVRAGNAVALKPEGRKAFFLAYEQRMDTLVTHPLFGYRVSYRRLLEIQTRLLARVLEGEITSYPVFTTR